MKIKNNFFSINVSEYGYLKSLRMINDPHRMNWVLSARYLERVGFKNQSLFGDFDFMVDQTVYDNRQVKPVIKLLEKKVILDYLFHLAQVQVIFDLTETDTFNLSIKFKNFTSKKLTLENFGFWSSFAYVMFRDLDVKKNIFNSAAVFPSISKDYTKLAVMRRTTKGKSLGFYQTEGKTLSVGTECQFENKFFEAVSPSLDGLLAHRLVLAGGYPQGGDEADWIYSKEQLVVAAEETLEWHYKMVSVADKTDFYAKGLAFGHPQITYDPMVTLGQTTEIKVFAHKKVKEVFAHFKENQLIVQNSLPFYSIASNEWQVPVTFAVPGEHCIRVIFEDGSEDQVVLNVQTALNELVEKRVSYLTEQTYTGAPDHIFLPVSNQGESIGKLSLIIKKNLLEKTDKNQILKVEESIEKYILPKWFEEGNLKKPKKVYEGQFYRVMDFEYIGHLFYLMSELENEVLQLQDNVTYLQWAAEVIELRINPELHDDIRGKEEAGMLGVFFLYMEDLIAKLQRDLPEISQKISHLWQGILLNVAEDSSSYRSAMTEHYYDNAGFGPAAGALAQGGYQEAAKRYADLVLANIGFSNDFRAQNADRWWEALTYMIHSLWGGVTAAAAYDAGFYLKDTELLKASYRATAGILYCYDTNANATTPLNSGEAASTYAVAGPHMERPDLSRARFGQETFAKDAGIFERLFKDSEDSTSDWDMGEELVAYLDRFGQNGFCWLEDQKLTGVNVQIKEEKDVYQIKNLAPYPKNIYLLTKQGFIAIDETLSKSSLIIQNDSCDIAKATG